MEIDCLSKKVLDKVIKLLEINKEDITYGGVPNKYKLYYGIEEETINNKTPIMTFKNINK